MTKEQKLEKLESALSNICALMKDYREILGNSNIKDLLMNDEYYATLVSMQIMLFSKIKSTI